MSWFGNVYCKFSPILGFFQGLSGRLNKTIYISSQASSCTIYILCLEVLLTPKDFPRRLSLLEITPRGRQLCQKINKQKTGKYLKQLVAFSSNFSVSYKYSRVDLFSPKHHWSMYIIVLCLCSGVVLRILTVKAVQSVVCLCSVCTHVSLYWSLF